MGEDRHPHPHGRFGWNQLLTAAPAEAAAFYQALLGWQVESGSLEGAEQHTLLQDGEPVASILGIPGDVGEALPHWHPHLNVDDVDARVALACELGARVVVEPGDIAAFGRLAVIQDPTGAVLTLVGPARDAADAAVSAADMQDAADQQASTSPADTEAGAPGRDATGAEPPDSDAS